MLQYVVYGPIMVDDIALPNGQIVRDILGGGGPQASFAAALWSDSVGLLARSGTDLASIHLEALHKGGFDLAGFIQYADVPTPRTTMAYDESEHRVTGSSQWSSWDSFEALSRKPLPIPSTYLNPVVMHHVLDFPHEQIVQDSLILREKGVPFSIEPFIDIREWHNLEAILEVCRQADVVTPDWPAACGIAKEDDPIKVIRFWAALGPQMIAIRDGARGSLVWDRRQDEIWRIPIVEVNVIDTTGAGNAYGGGMAVGWGETRDARLAGCYGAVSASFLVESIGLPALNEETRELARRRLEIVSHGTHKL